MRVNVKVNIGSKTQAVEDNYLARRIQKLADKLEKGSPIESDVHELVQEAEKNPKLREGLLDLAQNSWHNKNRGGEGPSLKKRFIGSIIRSVVSDLIVGSLTPQLAM